MVMVEEESSGSGGGIASQRVVVQVCNANARLRGDCTDLD